jgi:hypothetical protein
MSARAAVVADVIVVLVSIFVRGSRPMRLSGHSKVGDKPSVSGKTGGSRCIPTYLSYHHRRSGRYNDLVLLARRKHLSQHAHQCAVLQCSGDPFLVSQLLVDRLVGAVRALLDAYVDAEAGRQGLLEPDAYPQANDSG